MRTVGVLGGMGPEATIYFMQQVVAAVPAKDDADHIPLLVDNNPQVPSRIKAIIEGTGEDPAPVLAQMAKRLVGAGARALVMPCNTAHYYAEEVRAATDMPFLDMVSLSCREAAQIAPNGKVGLLGSPALQKVGVFDRPLATEGLKPVYATEPGPRSGHHSVHQGAGSVRIRGTYAYRCGSADDRRRRGRDLHMLYGIFTFGPRNRR